MHAALTATQRFKATVLVRLFGLKSIPLIFFCRPRVVAVSAERTEIVVPLGYLTKNHLGSLYFGALAIGADLSVGLYPAYAFAQARRREGKSVSFAFKSMRMNFFKRADGDAHFLIEGGPAFQAYVEKVLASEERHEIPVKGTVTVPKKYGNEPVAEFELVLSAKCRRK
jgi:hypothetical protein